MGRLAHLRDTLPTYLDQAALCAVVDYSCPENSGRWVEENQPECRVIRVDGRSVFNPSEARNAGARRVDTDWFCFVDADVRLAPDFSEVVRSHLQAGTYIAFTSGESAQNGIAGTCVVPRATFQQIGGYDEVYQGWGEEDRDLFHALELAGLERVVLPASLLSHIDHDDQARTQHIEESDRSQSWIVNRLYRQIKFDVMKLSGQSLPVDIRHQLRTLVRDALRNIPPGEKAVSLQIPIDNFELGLGPQQWNLSRIMRYDIVATLSNS